MKENWRKYDSVAETYVRVATPHYFASPAKDLVRMMRLPQGARVLDIGTGVGTVAAAAVEILGTEGFIVGVDMSVRMMVEARKCGLARLVAKDELSRAVKVALPSADRFTDADALEDALRTGGLRRTVVNQIDYPIRIGVSDYVAAKALGTSARFMQSLLSPDQWKQFIEAVSERLRADFGVLLVFTTKVNFAVGVK